MPDFFNLGLLNEIPTATFLSQCAQQSANPPNTEASFVYSIEVAA